MNTRKGYELERKLKHQLSGRDMGSTAGGSAKQESWTRPSQAMSPQKTSRRSGASKKTWLSKGVFEDSYQFGDLIRGLHGTALDAQEHILAGAFDIVENTIDSVAGRVAGIGIWEEPLKEFVKRDLIDEEGVARIHVRHTSPLGWKGMLLGVDTDRDSFLGDKAEGLAQSVGQLTLAKAATLAGIPGEAVTAVNAYGAEMENAYRNGATPREANISASIAAVGEVGTEMLSGAIKFGGTALDDLLVKNLSDGISNKLLKGLAGMVAGGVGEGPEEVLSEAINRFGQWITYMDDKTFAEMLFSGEAREAYMDSFLGGLFLGIASEAGRAVSTKNDGAPSEKTRGGSVQERAADPEAAQPRVTAPPETGRPTTETRTGDAPRRVQMEDPVGPVKSDMKPGSEEMTADPNVRDTDTSASERSDVPYFTSDHWTGELEGLWTETDARTAGDTAIDMDRVYGPDSETDTGKAELQQPVRYEDALKAYVQGDTRFSAKPDVRTGSSDAGPNADPTAGPGISRETAPKPKDQVIAELAPKLQRPGTTPGRAMISAEQTYAEAEKRFGTNASAVLEQIQPGQDPRRFLDGFQNAYILGKHGVNPNTLDDSSAAAYLTQAQRQYAFDLGAGKVKSLPAYSETADARDRLSAISVRGTTKLAQGFSAFPEGDVLNERIKKVRPDGNKFDVAMHGSPTAVAFGGTEANMSPHLLAEFIRHSDGYHGQDIRLLSCNTGLVVDGAYCFAEELANALGVTVWAPNDLLFVSPNGIISIGKGNRGRVIPYEPNERGRIK